MYLRINAFALTGRTNDNTIIPRESLRLPWAMRSLGFAFPLRAGDLWFSPFGTKSEILVNDNIITKIPHGTHAMRYHY